MFFPRLKTVGKFSYWFESRLLIYPQSLLLEIGDIFILCERRLSYDSNK